LGSCKDTESRLVNKKGRLIDINPFEARLRDHKY